MTQITISAPPPPHVPSHSRPFPWKTPKRSQSATACDSPAYAPYALDPAISLISEHHHHTASVNAASVNAYTLTLPPSTLVSYHLSLRPPTSKATEELWRQLRRRRARSFAHVCPAPSEGPAALGLLDLPTELHFVIFGFLDPIDSACFGVVHSHLYRIHRALHGRVSLAAGRLGPNQDEWVWRNAGLPVSLGLDVEALRRGQGLPVAYDQAVWLAEEVDRLGQFGDATHDLCALLQTRLDARVREMDWRIKQIQQQVHAVRQTRPIEEEGEEEEEEEVGGRRRRQLSEGTEASSRRCREAAARLEEELARLQRQSEQVQRLQSRSRGRRYRPKGQVWCGMCGVHRCELHRHLQSWMGPAWEYCSIRQRFGRAKAVAAASACRRSHTRHHDWCARHAPRGVPL